MQPDHPIYNPRFPCANTYDPDWVMDNQMGPNALWLTEWLCEEMDLQPGMRVLDMGCGRAMSSVFLAREFGVQVWANDLWIDPTDNWQRIRDLDLQDAIYPLKTEAHALPYAKGFFDAIVCIDAYAYFGTDDLYLNYFQQFVRSGGQIGIVVPGLTHELAGPPPDYWTRPQESGSVFWPLEGECWSFHCADWWQRHWSRTPLIQVQVADALPDGWRMWLQWNRALVAAGKSHFPSDEEALLADRGDLLALIRMVATRA